ncbi:MAG: hypothetical protein ACF8CY_05370, partial [Gimesia chilikensis]
MAYLDDLTTRRDNVAAELAAMDATKAGGKPNAGGGAGGSVDHVGYRQSLLNELDRLNAMINEERTRNGGRPFEITSEAR